MVKTVFLCAAIMMAMIIQPAWAMQETQTPEEIALERIEAARVSGATELDLSGLGLRALPPEIGQLTGLRYLYLANNELTELPPEIGQLAGFRALYLNGNQLTGLPPEIGHFG